MLLKSVLGIRDIWCGSVPLTNGCGSGSGSASNSGSDSFLQ